MLTVQLCARCRQEKSETDFSPFNRDKRGKRCRACDTEYARERYASQRRAPLDPSFSASYRAVHKRVQNLRGPAAAQTCAHCPNLAAHWAYDHTDPSPLRGEAASGITVEYSADPSRYQAMCRPCHARFDAGRRCPACHGQYVRTGEGAG